MNVLQRERFHPKKKILENVVKKILSFVGKRDLRLRDIEQLVRTTIIEQTAGRKANV